MQAVDWPQRTLKFVPIFEFRNYPDAYLSKPTNLRPTHTTSGQRVKQSRLFSLIFTSVFSDFHFSFHWLSLLFSLTFTSIFTDFHFNFHWLSLQFSLTFTSLFADFHFTFNWPSLLFDCEYWRAVFSLKILPSSLQQNRKLRFDGISRYKFRQHSWSKLNLHLGILSFPLWGIFWWGDL